MPKQCHCVGKVDLAWLDVPKLSFMSRLILGCIRSVALWSRRGDLPIILITCDGSTSHRHHMCWFSQPACFHFHQDCQAKVISSHNDGYNGIKRGK